MSSFHWQSKLCGLTMSQRMSMCLEADGFRGSIVVLARYGLLVESTWTRLDVGTWGEMAGSHTGLKPRCFFVSWSCTKCASCSTGCFPESNCSAWIFIMSLDYEFNSTCVHSCSGSVSNLIFHRAFSDSELWRAVRLFLLGWLFQFIAGSWTRKCNSKNIWSFSLVWQESFSVLDSGIYRVISRRGSQSDEDSCSLHSQTFSEDERLKEFPAHQEDEQVELGNVS